MTHPGLGAANTVLSTTSSGEFGALRVAGVPDVHPRSAKTGAPWWPWGGRCSQPWIGHHETCREQNGGSVTLTPRTSLPCTPRAALTSPNPEKSPGLDTQLLGPCECHGMARGTYMRVRRQQRTWALGNVRGGLGTRWSPLTQHTRDGSQSSLQVPQSCTAQPQ